MIFKFCRINLNLINYGYRIQEILLEKSSSKAANSLF